MRQKTMTILALSVSLASVMSPIDSLAQGMVVFDPKAYAQALQQVTAWKQQYQQMTQQVATAKQTVGAMTGSRNLGQILDNPEIHKVVPSDVAGLYKAVSTTGYGGLSATAKVLRDQEKIYNCEDQLGDQKSACEAALNLNAESEANQQNALTRLDQRAAQITALQGQINLTQDPKAIAELQARIAIEQANVQNDANRLAMMNALAETQRLEADQRLREQTLKMVSSGTHRVSETFVYQLPTQHP